MRFKKFTRTNFFESHKNQIKLVFSDNPNDTELKKICQRHCIDLFLFNSPGEDIRNYNLYLSDTLAKLLNSYTIEYCFSFGGRILEGEILQQYKDRIINFHPSLLPSFKGKLAIDKALEKNSFLLGNSAHFIIEEVDSGPVILQFLIHNSSYENYDELLDMQIYMLAQIISWLDRDMVLIERGKALIKGGDYSIGNFIPRLDESILESINIIEME